MRRHGAARVVTWAALALVLALVSACTGVAPTPGPTASPATRPTPRPTAVPERPAATPVASFTLTGVGSDLARFEQALASAGLLNNDEGSDAGRRVVQALEELDDPRALMGMATYHIVFTVSGWTSPFSFCTLALSGEQRARFFLRPATEEPVDSARAEGDISFDPADTPWGRLVAGLDQPYVTFSLGGECPRWTITGTLLP